MLNLINSKGLQIENFYFSFPFIIFFGQVYKQYSISFYINWCKTVIILQHIQIFNIFWAPSFFLHQVLIFSIHWSDFSVEFSHTLKFIKKIVISFSTYLLHKKCFQDLNIVQFNLFNQAKYIISMKNRFNTRRTNIRGAEKLITLLVFRGFFISSYF